MRRLTLSLTLLLSGTSLSAQGLVPGPRFDETAARLPAARSHGVTRGLLIGAGIGAVAGGAFGAWFAHGICDEAQCGDDALRGLGYGAVLGAVAGAGVGAGIAALFSKSIPVRDARGLAVRAAPIVRVPRPGHPPVVGLRIVLTR